MPDGRPPVRVLRLITRLNIGGPSIQAITLSERLSAHGFQTRLAFGRVGAGEGDMRYLLRASVDAREIASLQRALSPARDLGALDAVLRLMRAFRPHIVHTHM